MDQHAPELPTPVGLPKVESKPAGNTNAAEQASAAVGEADVTKSIEQDASQPMISPSAPANAPSPPPPVSPASTGPPMTNGTTAALGTLSLPQVADDSDLIEKEWVEKAKQIVAQTKDDPYRQNDAINKVKADYLKKRFNREMKVNDN